MGFFDSLPLLLGHPAVADAIRRQAQANRVATAAQAPDPVAKQLAQFSRDRTPNLIIAPQRNVAGDSTVVLQLGSTRDVPPAGDQLPGDPASPAVTKAAVIAHLAGTASAGQQYRTPGFEAAQTGSEPQVEETPIRLSSTAPRLRGCTVGDPGIKPDLRLQCRRPR